MFSTTSAIYLLASLAALRPSLADSAVFTETDAIATFYYDISETTGSSEACGSSSSDPVTAGWATASGINSGVPYCEKSRGKTLSELGTNAIVAFNSELVAADPAKWCGREVNIYDADGNKFDFDGGQLFIWDGCAACSDTDSQKIDLSAPAFAQLKGGTCAGDNPTGLTYEVLDTYFWDPSVGLGSGYSEEGGSSATSTDSGSQATSSQVATITTSSTPSTSAPTSVQPASTVIAITADVSVAVTTQATRTIRYSYSKATQASTSESSHASKTFTDKVLAVVDSATTTTSTATATVSASTDSASGATAGTTTSSIPVSSTTSVSSACTYGAWQCSGLSLQVCNYQSITELDWETIETCTSVCAITSSGSIDCE